MNRRLCHFASFLVATAFFLVSQARATIDVTLQMQLANPSNATTADTGGTSQHYLIQRPQYALDYNNSFGEPNWVSWDLTSGDVGGTGRSNDFEPDPLIASITSFYAVTTDDYNGVGAIDFNRGHMCPSEDRTDLLADNLAVFYMSNIVPQSADNNQGPWEVFEDYCRTLASQGNEILITSGPSGFNGSLLPSGKAQIPAYTWKIATVVPIPVGSTDNAVTRINNAGAAAIRVIAIKIPNISGIKSDPWQNYITTVAQISADTGLTFFNSPSLNSAVALGLQTKLADGQVATGFPTISVQPVPQTSAVGGSATFSMTASDAGNPPLTYQWFKDDNQISGATNPTLTLNNIQATDAGSYSVTVTNALGPTPSNSAALIVTGIAPGVTSQPVASTVNAGDTAVFSIAASGSPTLTYQWRKGGTPITGNATATTAVLTIANAQAADAANYDVVVTNSTSSATSNAVALTVNAAAPTIIAQPTPVTAITGGSATFNVTAKGTNPLSYQWQFNGTPITGNASATTSSLTVTNVQVDNAGNYSVVVTNGVGTPATSNAVALTIGTGFSTGTIAVELIGDGVTTLGTAALPVVVQTYSRTGTLGQTIAFPSASPAPTAVPYNLTDSGTNTAEGFLNLSTDGKFLAVPGYNAAQGLASLVSSTTTSTPPVDRTIGIISPAGAETTPIAANVLSGAAYRSVSSDGTNFWVSGSTGLAYVTSTGVVTAIASGTARNAAIFNGTLYVTSASATFGGGTSVPFGLFQVGSVGSLPTGSATITSVIPTGGSPYGFAISPDGNWAYIADDSASAVGGIQKWHLVSGAWALQYTLSSGATNIGARGLTVDFSNFNATTGMGAAIVATTAEATANRLIYFASDTGSATTAATLATAGTDYIYRGVAFAPAVSGPVAPMVSSVSPLNGSNTASALTPITVTFNEPVSVASGWFAITSAANGPLVASVSNTNNTTFTFNPPGPFTPGDTISVQILASGVADQATGSLHPAADYSFSFSTVAPVAPGIATQPQPQTVLAGGTATFAVVASGTAPFSYQWQKNGANLTDGGNISGSTSSTLVVASLQSGDAGNYTVVVSNGVNPAAASTAALLTVTPVAPSILNPPASQTVTAGANVSFTVAAAGSAPFTYQWQKNSANLIDGGEVAGSQTATLILTGTTVPDSGSYTVIVGNGVGTPATSAAAVLTVNPVLSSTFGYGGGTYTQNFDTLPATGTFSFTGAGPFLLAAPAPGVNASGLVGWSFGQIGGTGSNATFRVDTGSSNAGAIYSYGSSTAPTDRALGSVASGSVIGAVGFSLVNTTAQTITQFTVTYTGEEWRSGGTETNTFAFDYSLASGATVITETANAFTLVPALNFVSPANAGTNGLLDGNAAANRTTGITATVTGISWAPGQTLILRWSDANDSGNDDGIAIDDFSFTTPVAASSAPVVTTAPLAQAGMVGGKITLSVVASGSPAPTYQWQKNGVNLSDGGDVSGSQTATLTLTGAGSADAGNYDVVVTNSVNSVTTTPVAVTLAGFKAGELVVERMGNGSAALSSAATPLFLDEFNTTSTAQTADFTVAIPTTAAGVSLAVTDSGSASSDGFMTRSTDGRFIAIPGYNVAAGTAGVAATVPSATANQRAIAVVDAGGNAYTATASSTANSANNIRSATTIDGTSFWSAGSGSPAGIEYFPSSGIVQPTATVSVGSGSSVTNTRVVRIVNVNGANTLYYSTGSAPIGIYAFNGVPTTTPAAPTQLVTDAQGTSPNPEGFAVNSTGTVMYVAETQTTAKGGGILKYTQSGGTWTYAYTISTGGTTGALALTADFPNSTIYATTTETSANRLIAAVDGGSAATSTVTTLATAPANEGFRAVDFAPVAGSSSQLAPIALQPQPQTVTAGSSATFSVTADDSAAATYQWQKNGTAISDGGEISGSNTATLTLNPAQVSDAGTYTVVVTTGAGSVTSAGASFVVNAAAPPGLVAAASTTYRLNAPAAGPAFISGVISDPTDPAATSGIDFTVSDAVTPVQSLVVSATSSNAAVVANDGTGLTFAGTGATRTLKIVPTGVGYSTITVTVTNSGAATATYVINYAASAASVQPATARFFTGASDGSTAQAVDSTHFFIGDDENQALRLYDRTQSGLPVASFDFTSLMGFSDPTKEVDIESSLRIGNRIYWIGSGSNDSSFATRPNRSIMFATDLTGTGATATLAYVGQYDLKDDLIAWDQNNVHGFGANYYGLAASAASGVDPKTPTGYNVEGAELAPDGATGYIGFRAPMVPPNTRAHALVIPVTNFGSLIGQPAGSATFGAPIEFDLGGRGIREMKKNAANQYLIIAGPSGGATGVAPLDFRLYTWDGVPADAPQLRSANLTAITDPGAFEGIIDLPTNLTDTSVIQIIMDCGTDNFYADGVEAKDLASPNFKKTEMVAVTLGSVVAISPVTLTVQPVGQSALAGGTVTLSVTATGSPAPTYQWQKNGANISGATNATLTLANLQAGDSGSYTVVVTNSQGSVTSTPALVSVLSPLPRTVISGWDFQNLSIAINLTPASNLGSITGLASTLGMTNSYGTPGNSVDQSDIAVAAGSSDMAATNNAWRVRSNNGSNGWSSLAPIGTQGAQFLVNTTGFSSILVRFDVDTTSAAEANLQLQYTLDGTTWQNAAISYTGTAATIKVNTSSANTVQGTYIQFTTGIWYNGITADFSAIPGADNNPSFGVRMVNASTGVDDINGSGTAYNNSSGNWRFDEVQVQGVPATAFAMGNLVVSRSVYADVGAVGALLPGASLPDSPDGTTPYVAVANGSYPNVFNNTTVDANFGVTSKIYLDQLTPSGTLVGSLPVPTNSVTTSFPSKSEVGLNLSPDGQTLTFMGYVAPAGAMDISNSNTPAIIEPGNFVTANPTYRAVVAVDPSGNFTVTTTNAYAGNNGRAAISANGLYYTVGNAGAGNGSALITAATGVQIVVPGQNATASTPGTQNVGSFSITQEGDAADKTAKDNNFRGETIFNNTLYVSKGSGSNGINTVYQVGTAGTLPTLATAATAPISVLPGFPTLVAKSATGVSHPFGLWFANATTLYVADEGDGVLADLTNSIDPNSGLQKWVLVSGTWQLAYTLQSGLSLGANYIVSNSQGSSYLPTATDGLRNLTGKVNGDGTVTLYAVTSTVSASGDQGADPNRLVTITDTLAFASSTQASAETFSILRSAGYGEVLRGVSFTPTAAAAAAPIVLTQPVGATVTAGATVTLSVSASGVPAPSYQWMKGANTVAGANSSTLILTDAQVSDSGSYTVVITNGSGSVTSNAAVVVVNPAVAPVITTPPAPQTTTVGGTVTFSVTASAGSAATFQWQKNGNPITNATSSTLTLTNVQASDAGSYTVVLTNGAGSVTSTPVTLTVNAAVVATGAVISGWDFQGLTIGTNLTPVSDIGTVAGQASTLGMTNTYGTPTSSTDISDVLVSAGSSDQAATNNAWRVRGGPTAPAPATANGWSSLAPIGTQGAQFSVNTTGYTGIQLRFDVNTTTQAEANLQVQYTVDGTNWINAPIAYSGAAATVKVNTTSANTVMGSYIQFTTGAWYNGIVADFSTIPGVENNPNFGVRLVNASTGADNINGAGTAYNDNSGNWRFDEVQVLGNPATAFAPGNLVVSRSVYADVGAVGALQPGANLPDSPDGVTSYLAAATGAYPNVFNNTTVDANFGVTSGIYLDQVTTAGTLVGTLPVPTSLVTTSFPSKSEVALNLSPDGQTLTFMGYNAPAGAMDISNSNTPGIVEPGNFVTAPATYREVVAVDPSGNFTVTTTNAYAGNNGRAAISANGLYYTVGNAGAGNGSAQITAATGVQIVVPGQNATASTPGTQNVGSFSITQVGDAADKTAKDNNFRGETIFNNTLYVSKGSGSNGINTVYQVGTAGTLPTLATAATTPITVLPGFPMLVAKSATGVSHPFGLWFADATTLYVADEGDGVLADLTNSIDPNSGLQKWVLVSGTWQLAYTIQSGLNLGVNYTVTDDFGNSYFPTATDGLRNLTGKVNGDGTVTLYAITSTVSASGDEGADPNRLVTLTDTLAFTSAPQASAESFSVLRSARFAEVLRGVSFTPTGAVSAVPTIVSQPQGVSTVAGSTVTLSVGATGVPTPTYQWQKGTSPISGATSSSLTLNNVQVSDAGSYSVVVSNGSGTITSNAATVSVTPATAPSISTAPVSQTALVGAAVTFTAAATASPAATYQWEKNGNTIAGATSASLTLSNVQLADAGSYTVVATNSAGSVTSAPALLTINVPAGGASVAIGGWDFQNLAIGTDLTPVSDLGTVAGVASTLGMTNSYGTPDASTDISDILVSAGSSDPAATNNAWRVRGGPTAPAPATANGWSSLAPIGTQGAQFSVDTTGYQSIKVKFDVNTTTQAEANLQLEYTLDGSTWTNFPISYSGAAATVKVNTTSANTVQGTYLQFTAGAWYTGISADLSSVTGAANNPHFGIRLVNASTDADDINGAGTAYNNNSGNWRFDEVQILGVSTVPVVLPTIVGASTASGTVGSAFSLTLTTGTTPATSFTATGLPPGLAINSTTGVISGTPTTAGTYPAQLAAVNGSGTGPSHAVLFQINPATTAPIITSAPVAAGTAGGSFNYVLTASNTPTSFVVTSGTLPAGLALNATTGAITGTPTQAGQSTVWIAATNDSGQGVSLGVLFNIAAGATTPAITSNATAAGRVGTAFSYQIIATNSPTSYAASSLPAGLTLDPVAGTITGVPTTATAAPFSVTLTAANTVGTSNPATLLISIAPAAATPVITSPATAVGQVGTAFSYQTTASATPTSFAALNLSAGLTINSSTGLISGTPTAAGVSTATVQAGNTAGLGAAANLALVIAPSTQTPAITSAASVTGTVGQALSYSITASPGPITSYGLSGTLPLGLALDPSAGVISGVPSEPGQTQVTLTVTNSTGSSLPQVVIFAIAPLANVPMITSAANVSGTVGASFSFTITATNVPLTGPFAPAITLDAVNLPPGLAVNPSTGIISGTPTAAGTYVASVVGTNATGTGAASSLTFTILPAAAAPVITSGTAVSAQVGVVFSYPITASNLPTSFAALNAPPWLTVNSQTGVINGTPDTPGSVTVQLSAANASGSGPAATLTIAIAPAANTPVVTSARTANGTLGSSFSYAIAGSLSPTSYLATGLPSGLSLNSITGVISGTPTSSGTYPVIVSGSNTNGQGAPVTVTLVIASSFQLTGTH